MIYERIKNMPTSRDGKMIYGILAAVAARLMIEHGVATMPENGGDALMAFGFAGILLFTLVLAIARYNTGRPLFEPFKLTR